MSNIGQIPCDPGPCGPARTERTRPVVAVPADSRSGWALGTCDGVGATPEGGAAVCPVCLAREAVTVAETVEPVPAVWPTLPLPLRPDPAEPPGDPVEGVIVAIKKSLLGPKQVRIAFREACPYDFFKAVVYGPDAANAEPQPSASATAAWW